MPLTNYQERKLNYVVKKPSGDLAHANTRRQTHADLNPTHSKKNRKKHWANMTKIRHSFKFVVRHCKRCNISFNSQFNRICAVKCEKKNTSSTWRMLTKMAK